MWPQPEGGSASAWQRSAKRAFGDSFSPVIFVYGMACTLLIWRTLPRSRLGLRHALRDVWKRWSQRTLQGTQRLNRLSDPNPLAPISIGSLRRAAARVSAGRERRIAAHNLEGGLKPLKKGLAGRDWTLPRTRQHQTSCHSDAALTGQRPSRTGRSSGCSGRCSNVRFWHRANLIRISVFAA